jgi:hypothetical protein
MQWNKRKQSGLAFTYMIAGAAALGVLALAAFAIAGALARPSAAVDKLQGSRTILANAVLAIARSVSSDTDSTPLPPMGTVQNGDGYAIPSASGAPQADAWGMPIRYCPWDNGQSNASAGRLAGAVRPTAATPLFALISAGPDQTFSTSCADVKAGTPAGDDLFLIRTLNDYHKDGIGNAWVLSPVDCENSSVPVRDATGAPALCSSSSSRLDLVDTATLKEGQQIAVRKSAKLFIWQGNAWRIAGGVGPGSYPAPAAFVLTDQSMQLCGATLTSNAVQVNGIAAGTPISITSNGSYASSADGVAWSGFSSSVSTISAGSWIKLRASTPMADFGVTSVTLNIGGAEKIWNVSNDVCKCNLPWGGTIDNGQTTTAYNTTSVPFGNLCASEQRSCTLTTLGGTAAYQYGSCYTIAGAACSLPWGATVSHGNASTAYASSTVSYTTGACSSETRNCWNGSLSGTNTKESCTVLPAAACNLPGGGSIVHGASAVAYKNVLEPYGGACQPQTRSCNDGSLSGSYANDSCSVQTGSPCASPLGGTIQPGNSITAWNTTAAYGYACQSETRSCSGPGNLSGSYTAASCQHYRLVSQGYTQYQCWNTSYVDTSGYQTVCSGPVSYVDTSHFEQQCSQGPWVDTSAMECHDKQPLYYWRACNASALFDCWDACRNRPEGADYACNQGCSDANCWQEQECAIVPSGYYAAGSCSNVWVASGYWDYSQQSCSQQWVSDGYWNQDCGNVWVDTSYWVAD